jgi:glycosyltransferase involved in cell wall biosynthesis
MKVALVHDYLKEYGGAERVLEALHEIYPEAPIYTLVYAPEFLGPHRERVEKWDIHPIITRWIPLRYKFISPLRLLAPILFKRLNLSQYEVVIVSATGAYNPNLVRTDKRRSSHICYCHTPPRYLYGLPTAREWKKYWWFRFPAELANHFLRLVDFQSAQKVDYFIANSKNTARRIWKFYRKEATVIYPPVDISNFDKTVINHQFVKGDYFLAGGRLARPKRIDLAIQACNRLKLPLKVFGRAFAGYGEELKRIAGPTVEFLGEVTDEEKAKLYASCRAYIFPAEEEDFGISPVEAMAAGRPVIALRQGGVLESIIEGKTGEFFDEPTVESLVEVLKKFKPEKYKPEDCRKQAEKFSKERFKREIREFVEEKYA